MDAGFALVIAKCAQSGREVDASVRHAHLKWRAPSVWSADFYFFLQTLVRCHFADSFMPLQPATPPFPPPRPPPPPPSTLACWREPCNNPPCFHDNHLLLSSPRLSLSPFCPPSVPSHSVAPLFPLSSAHCWYFKVRGGKNRWRFRSRDILLERERADSSAPGSVARHNSTGLVCFFLAFHTSEFSHALCFTLTWLGVPRTYHNPRRSESA